MFFNQRPKNNPPNRKPNHAWRQALLFTLLLALLAYLTPAFASGDAESLPLSAEALLNDPLSITEVKLTASDMNSGDQFGHSVSLSGEMALVGAPYNYEQGESAGAAYLLGWNGSQWVQEAKLVASDGTAHDYFGYSVSLSGDVALVGAYGDDDDGGSSGSAYIFRKHGNEWVQEAKLTANDGAASLLFGYSVSLAGDVALIGAHQDDAEGNTSGSAYIFRWDGSQWVEEANLTANDGTVDDHFGQSVSLAGDVALVGAYRDDEHGSYSGAAYIFRKDGNEWVQKAKLTSNAGTMNDFFGNSVSLAGNVALIGAYRDNHNGSHSGAAYIFRLHGSQWVEEAKLTANDGSEDDYFAQSVSVAGDVALVGASRDDEHGSHSGSAYIFRKNGNEWEQETKLTANDGAADDYFGVSVSLSGNVALVGALGDDENGSSSGSAYIFRKNGNDWVQEAKLTANDGGANDIFGSSVSLAGEVVLVGTSFDDDHGMASGSVYIFAWNGSQWVQEIKFSANDGARHDLFGRSVNLAGDVLVVGAMLDDDNGSNSGSAYVYELSDIIGEPAIEVSPASFSVALAQGQSTSETFTISNTGALRLTWEMRENAGWLNPMPLSGSVVPSDSVTVSLAFDARGLSVGSYTETLRINSNDPDEPTIEVPVTLSVTPAPPPDILAIHALAFDSEPTSDVNLSPLFHQTIEEMVEVTAENRDRMAVVLADLDGAADTRIFVVRHGYVTSIVGLPDAGGLLSPGLSEYDMTDGETLGGFLKWALEGYAAAETKTSFSYVSHGTFLMPAIELSTLFTDTMAFRTPSSGEGSIFPLPADVYAKSSFSDQHPQQAMITPHALQVALDIATNDGNNPLEVLDIVHCFSGSIEEFYELSNAGGMPYATTLVGSANYSYFAPQMLARSLAAFEAQDDAATMASKIVETHDLVLQEVDELDEQATSRHPRTMVAMQSSQIPMIKDKIDEMAWYLMQEFETVPIATKDKLAAAYGATGAYYDSTYCSPQDWELASPDALVRAFS